MTTKTTFETLSSDHLATATGGAAKDKRSSTDQAFDEMQRFWKENPDFKPGLQLCTRGYSEPCLH